MCEWSRGYSSILLNKYEMKRRQPKSRTIALKSNYTCTNKAGYLHGTFIFYIILMTILPAINCNTHGKPSFRIFSSKRHSKALLETSY